MLLTKPRDYQQEGVRRGLQHNGFAYFCEQRTGKCLIAIALAEERKPDYILIVCPKKAIRVWRQELEKHWKPEWPIEIEIINYEQIQPISARRRWTRWIRKANSSLMIVDEAHRIKKRGSKQSRGCRTIGKHATWRLALTGTPLSKRKSIEDAWAIFEFIRPGIFGPYADKVNRYTGELIKKGFAGTYLRMGGFKGKKVIGIQKKNFPKFLKIFHKYSYRVTLREVRKKSLIVRRIKKFLPMHPENRQHAENLEKRLRTVVRSRKVKISQLVNLSNKLQQITGGFLLTTPEDSDDKQEVIALEHQEKLKFLRTLVPQFEKMLIVARFTHEIRAIERLCKRLGRTVKTIEGGIEYDGRFNTDVIILQIQAGIAMDLSAAKVIIWYSWNHSYIDHEQMRFRVLSYDTKQILYYYLLVKNSIDLPLYESVVRKKKLADLVCDHYRRK